MHGIVVRLMADKGFGFIRGDDGTEYFFHRSMATIELAVRAFDRDLEVIAGEASSPAPR
jgi:cold shock CspA family protein